MPAEILARLPKSDAEHSSEVIHFSGITAMAGLEDRLIIQLSSSQERFPPWIATFSPGYGSPAIDVYISDFDTQEDSYFVVSGGQGYYVDASNRSHWRLFEKPFPIVFADKIQSSDVIIVGDFSRVAALYLDDIVWMTDSFGDGRLLIERIDTAASRIVGGAWDAPSQEYIPFSIDLGSGAFV